jgi:hypothetical protein
VQGLKPSSHCLHLPNLPTPHTLQAVASSLLLVPRNFTTFTAPTAAHIGYYIVLSLMYNFVRLSGVEAHSQYKLLKPTALSGCTSKQAGEYSVYKSVLQVTSSNLRTHLTFMLLQAISFIRPQYAPLHFTSFSLAGSVIRGRLLNRRPLIPSHKAKPPLSAQLINMLHQLAFISFHSLRSFRSSFTLSLSQPHRSTPVWQPGYCHRTSFRLAGRFLSHIPPYSDRQARKPTST